MMGRRTASAGYTLVEVLVALVLLLLALALAAQLLLESQRRFLLAGREQQDMLVSPAIEQIREDIRSSTTGVVFAGRGDEPDALILDGHPIGTIRYEVVKGDLRRIVLDRRGVAGSNRPMLRRVTRADWSLQLGLVISLDLIYERQRTLHVRAISSPRPRAYEASEENLVLTVFLRGRSRLNRW